MREVIRKIDFIQKQLVGDNVEITRDWPDDTSHGTNTNDKIVCCKEMEQWPTELCFTRAEHHKEVQAILSTIKKVDY